MSRKCISLSETLSSVNCSYLTVEGIEGIKYLFNVGGFRKN